MGPFFFFAYARDLNERFSNLFEETETLSGIEKTFSERYGALHSIYSLAEFDILRIDAVTQVPIEQFYLMLSYKKDKAEVEKYRIKQASRK